MSKEKTRKSVKLSELESKKISEFLDELKEVEKLKSQINQKLNLIVELVLEDVKDPKDIKLEGDKITYE